MINSSIAARSDNGNELRFHGKEVGVVLVVGVVEEFTRQQAALEFTLNDATGSIRARHFFRSEAEQLQGVKQGGYVSAVGTVKVEPFCHFSIIALRPVESPDEISYHMIESAHTALKMRKDSVKSEATLQTGMASVTSSPPKVAHGANDLFAPPKIGADTPTSKSTGGLAFSPPKAENMTKFQGAQLREELQRVLQKEGGRELGVSLEELSVLAVSPDEAKRALAELLDDGSVYTTIDDDHFAAV
jgi:hypothetical protein